MTQDVESPVAGSKSKKKVVNTTMKHSKKLHKEKCLYLRYKHRKPPSRDEVRLLHPNIIDVRFPRQKSAKFCHLEFETKEAALEAMKQLKKTCNKDMFIQYLGTRLSQSLSEPVSTNTSIEEEESDGENDSSDYEENSSKIEEQVAKKSKKDKNLGSPKCIHVSGLPDLAVEEVIKNLFPDSKNIEIGDKKLKGKRYALVHFQSNEEATRAMEASKGVSVNGDKLVVKFLE